MEARVYIDTGSTEGTDVKTTADQAYIDISSSLEDMGHLVRVTERENDKPVTVIPYQDFIALYPDPTADKSEVADHAALWNNRLYLGPTPNTADIVYYVEFTAIPTEITSASTLPYKRIYDPLVVAVCEWLLADWLDSENYAFIKSKKDKVASMKEELIKPINLISNRQTDSRKTIIPYFSPKKVIS